MRKILLPDLTKTLFVLCFTGGLLSGTTFAGNFQDTTRNIADTTRSTITDENVVISPPATFPVLYGDQPFSNLTQSIGYLNGKTLESSPVTLLSNAFAGRLAGLYAQQNTGVPKFDNPALSIRGRRPLTVIDDIPRYDLINSSGESLYDVLSLNPEQIESVTLLKDALSTAMLGNRGMDGVLMVRTRKNSAGKSAFISVKAQAGIHSPIGMRKQLSAFDYASLYNEALTNSGYAPAYSAAQLSGYQTGSNRLIYPNTNWQDEVLKDNALSQRYNLNASGNFTNLSYFVSLDYQNQKGLFKEDPNSSYGTNIDYKRYIFRSNLELKVDKMLTANLKLLGNIQDFIQPGAGYASVYRSVLTTPNLSSPVTNQNGSFAGSRLYPLNPYAEAVSTGYLKDNLQANAVDLSATRKMDDVVKGAWLKAAISYNPSYNQQIDRSKDYNAYYVASPGDTLRVNTISPDQNNSSTVTARFQQTYAQLFMGYDRQWGVNKLSGLLTGMYESSQSNNLLNEIYKGISGRLSYLIADKYNIEASGAYTSNNRYAEGNQGYLYPAIGASWNISKENFLKDSKFINDLKLRTSFGRVGNAVPGYYLFRQVYTSNSAYFFGTGATSSSSISRTTLADPNRVDEKADKFNLGMDIAYSKNRGWLSVDYFNNRQFDMLQQRGGNTAILGQNFPDENIGENRIFGWELSTGWSETLGKLRYSIAANVSSLGSEVLFNDEPTYPNAYLARTGQPVNQIRGYVADGFFNTGNLNGPTMSGFIPSPGDVKYRDLNNDGVINMLDQTVIANDNSLIFYGLNFGLEIRGFDMSLLVQGAANRDIVPTGFYQYPFTNGGLGQAYEYNLNRYNASNTSSATLPRVTVGNDINNYITSSLFVMNGNFLRLKNVELGYTFSSKLLSSIKVKQIRVFANGFNLATFSKYKDADPEAFNGLYPVSRIINGGLSVKI